MESNAIFIWYFVSFDATLGISNADVSSVNRYTYHTNHLGLVKHSKTKLIYIDNTYNLPYFSKP